MVRRLCRHGQGEGAASGKRKLWSGCRDLTYGLDEQPDRERVGVGGRPFSPRLTDRLDGESTYIVPDSELHK
jgi:hypothetical protein